MRRSAGFQPPGTACWTFSYVTPAPRVVKILALANRSGREQCGVLASGDRIILFLHNDGSAMRLTPGERL